MVIERLGEANAGFQIVSESIDAAVSRAFYRLAYRTTHGKWNGRQVALPGSLKNDTSHVEPLRMDAGAVLPPQTPGKGSELRADYSDKYRV